MKTPVKRKPRKRKSRATRKRTKIHVKRPYKQQEFEMYKVWKGIPAILLGESRDDMEKVGFRDSVFFAARFKIKQRGTLADWNKILDEDGSHMALWNKLMSKLTMNVDAAYYKLMIDNPSPQGWMNWHKIREGWTESESTPQQPIIYLMGAYPEKQKQLGQNPENESNGQIAKKVTGTHAQR